MGTYDPSDELDLISYWTQIEDVDEGDSDFGKDHRPQYRRHQEEEEELSPKRKVSFLRMPVAGFAGADLELMYGKGDVKRAGKRMSVLEPTDKLTESSGALQQGSLRGNALARLWDKLNFLGTDEIQDLVAQGASGPVPKFVVMQQGQHQVINALSIYERGLLEYALPRLRDVCEREGSLPKRKFITICGLCLAGSKQISEMHAAMEGSPNQILTPRDARATGTDYGASEVTPMPGRRARSASPVKSRAWEEAESEGPNSMVSSVRPEVHSGSALDLMLGRIFDKLDPDCRGYLDCLPDKKQAGMTAFEGALLELAQYQLQYELKNHEGGQITKQRAVDIFKMAMDQDYPGMDERRQESSTSPKKSKGQQGYPPLETAMRSVYREALRIRKPVHREPTNEELELAECTFHPAINRPPEKSASGGPAQPRSRTAIFAGTQSRSMSTRDMQEIVELQECTFTPNLYKHLTQSPKKAQRLYDFDMQAPQYRSKRRGPNVLVQELEKREVLEGHARGAMHIHGARGKWYWQENLRKENALSQYTLNLSKANVDLRDKPDSGMDLGPRAQRHDETRTRAAPRDWGKYIRVHDVRYQTENKRDAEPMTEDEHASRAFAETFLSLRQSAPAGAGPRRGGVLI